MRKLENKISNGMKHDLGMVFCDAQSCAERGEYPRCYLDVYRNCIHYQVKQRIELRHHEKRKV